MADFGSVQRVAYIIPIAVGLLVGRKGARRRSGSVNVSRAVSRYREPIHPSAWNRNSANFALTEFSEVRCLQATPKQHQNNPFWCCP